MKVKNILFVSLVCLLFLSCAESSATTVTVIFTASANGVLESCRCPGNPFGGLINRAAVIDSLRRVYPEALVVDAGDFLPFRPDSLKSVFVVRAMNLCNYDAISPGDQDLSLGRDFIICADLPLVSSNIFLKDSKEPLFSDHREFNRAGITFSVAGLFAPSLTDFLPDSTRSIIDVLKPDSLWWNQTRQSKEDADVLIILSHTGYDRDVAFLSENAGVDLLVSGHSQMLIETPEHHNGCWLVAAGKNGEYVGVIRLKLSDDNTTGIIEYRLIPLIASEVGESTEVSTLVDEYNRLHREKIKRQAIAAGRRYHGTGLCKSCHAPEFDSWSQTPHARALETLRLLNEDNNSSCLECHTTGYGFPGGFEDSKNTIEQAGVGCEECHAIPPGEGFDRQDGHKVLPVMRRSCDRCHIKPHIVEFDYEKKKASVDHSGAENNLDKGK